MPDNPVDPLYPWLSALRDRHARDMTTPELTRAIRALSARYVEGRAQLANRSPLDSAGKRAAFAVFYAPLHALTTREVVRALGTAHLPASRLLDLGCGSGAASAAWALEMQRAPSIAGVDALGWAVSEATWTWRTLRIAGTARRGDMVATLERLTIGGAGTKTITKGDAKITMGRARTRESPPAVLLAWSANELMPGDRSRLLGSLRKHFARGGPALVIEPIARAATPWWDEWAAAFLAAGGRADTWKFDVPLPDALAELNEAARFGPRTLTARSLWFHGQ